MLRKAGIGGLLVCAALATGWLQAAQASDRRGHCRQDVGRDFEAAPQEAGALAAPLLKLNEALDAAKYDIRSLLVLRDCKLLFERYRADIGREHNQTLYSVTKSFAATIVGALLHSGKLATLDAPIADFMQKPAGVRADSWAENSRVTLRNVMQMASGFDFRQAVGSNPIYFLNTDRFAHALNTRLIAPPGTKFNYSDADASVTGAFIAAASGNDLYSTAKELLFEPMQMVNHDWMFVDAAGRYPGGWGLRLRPMDMAKLGQLYLQDCVWNGKVICTSSYIAEVLKPGAAKNYGLHWWLGKLEGGADYFYANGVKGQRIFVLPSYGLVAVSTAILPPAEVREVDALLLTALSGIAPDDKTPADEAALAKLVALQATGFQGETRNMRLQDQDYPRAPS